MRRETFVRATAINTEIAQTHRVLTALVQPNVKVAESRSGVGMGETMMPVPEALRKLLLGVAQGRLDELEESFGRLSDDDSTATNRSDPS